MLPPCVIDDDGWDDNGHLEVRFAEAPITVGIWGVLPRRCFVI